MLKGGEHAVRNVSRTHAHAIRCQPERLRAPDGLSRLACALMSPRLFEAVKTRSSVQFVGGVALAVGTCLLLRDRARRV